MHSLAKPKIFWFSTPDLLPPHSAEEGSIPGPSGNINNRSATVFSPSPSTSVGSLNKVNIMTGHLNGNEISRSKKYTDQESEIAWVQHINREQHRIKTPRIEDSVTLMNLELRLLPHKSQAAHLLDVFLESVEPSFPLINQSLFIPQFDHVFTHSEPKPSRQWLAVLYLILATGSKYCQLAEPASGKDADDHVFLSRAIASSKSRGLATGYTDLQQVQIGLLLAIYYLAAGQVNRSWQIIGRAALSATSMGLNLCVVGDQIDPMSKEMGTRIWWSIFCLEHLLSGMTGYTLCVDCRSVSASPPLPYDENHFRLPGVEELLRNDAPREKRPQWTVHTSNMELQFRNQWFRTISPSGSLYFFHLVDLSITTHAAVNAVYSPTATKDKCLSKISFYQEKLETWLSGLQKPFACTTDNYSLGKKKIMASNCREQVSLSLAYYSSQIILSRPCLTRTNKAGINSKAPRSRFEDDVAKTRVHFALTLISVLPNEPNIEWIFKMTPWWCILYFIRQALTVLLIQLAIGPVPVTTVYCEQSSEATEGEEAGVVLNASKKALRWLHSLTKQDPSSRRALQISNGFLRCVKDMSLDPSQAEQASSKLQGSGDLSPRSLKLRDDALNWGRDCTVSDVGYEQQQAPFFLDPTHPILVRQI
ncbi:fungal specific transcription factor domain-containing protein [Aspergillus undulatus]|uniref:fungal specific transcription factor domain-containing protein n=1 Tax=Aspergillus undulatus TaxID=1810928 RepID=UPI003CCD87E5